MHSKMQSMKPRIYEPKCYDLRVHRSLRYTSHTKNAASNTQPLFAKSIDLSRDCVNKCR